MNEIPIAVPKSSPDPLPELAIYLEPFVCLFRRPESRQSLERYITGLLTDLSRKNCDTIAAAVAGTSVERLQHLLTDAEWDPVALDQARVRQLAEASPSGGILVFDDTGLPKQGKSSVGVARQYSGTLGKVGNCQVVVSAQYTADEPASSTPWHWPVTARLYLPKKWAEDPVQRERAHVPPDVTFQTKPEIALALLDQAREWQVPFGFVVADPGYGDNPRFLDGLAERGMQYICGIERTFGVRLPAEIKEAAIPVPTQPARRGKGRPKLPRPAPLHTAVAITDVLAEEAWQTVTWREGSKGALQKQFVAVRVHRATGNPAVGPYGRSVNNGRMSTGEEGWLLAERPLPGEEGDRKWYYSNISADVPLRRLVELAHSRWVIEQFYEDAKGECGLDDYQGRRWDGLHWHLALTMLSYSFLACQRNVSGSFPPLRGAPKSAGHTPPGVGVAPAESGAMVHRHRPNQNLPPSKELTK